MPRITNAFYPAALIAATSAVVATAGEITIPVIADATLYENLSGDTANGSGRGFFVGRNNSGGLYRSLLKFDIAGELPAGATIESVSLTLYCSRTIAPPTDVSLHRAIGVWDEGPSDPFGNEGAGAPAQAGDVTWLYTSFTPPGPGSPAWNNPGGDFEPTPSATSLVQGEAVFYTWESAQLAADVQAWLDGTTPNDGWLMIGEETGSGTTSKRFSSKDDDGPVPNPPALTIVFSAGGGCNDADIAEPFGTLDLMDLDVFIDAFLARNETADIAEPFGVWDLADIQAFIAAFNAGCP
jgi:hypothetical protein